MIQNLEGIVSENAKHMRRSVIRDLLAMAAKPEIISFGGGFPSPDSFPVEQLKEVMNEVLTEMPAQALQYGESLGVKRLREVLAERYQKQGLNVTYKNIIITTSSQQALDMISNLFLDPGDTVVCGLPSYLGALQAFTAHQGQPVGVRKDEELDSVITGLEAVGKKPKFIYAIPDFHNPSGITMDIPHRQLVLDVAHKHDLLLVEDSPYREIRFEGEEQPLMYSLDKDERVILLGTFSKTFVPGFRLGWIVAPEPIIAKLEVVKQSVDLCAPVFNQYVAAKFIEKGYLDENIEKIKIAYRKKKDNMMAAFEKYMPKGVKWTNPEGGLFLQVTLPEGYDSKDLFKIAIEENVAFIIGEAFYCDGSGQNTLRMNFSFTSEDRALDGIKRLGKAIERMFNEKK